MQSKRLLLVVALLALTVAAIILVLTGPKDLLGFVEYGAPSPASSGASGTANSASPGVSSVGIVINEVMPSNSGAVTDESGASSDWLELYNPTQSAVALSGFSLTDDPSGGAKYAFPALTLEPGAYLVVFASGRDVRSASAPFLHVPFKLKGGENLLLTDATGQTVDSVNVPDMPSNVSVGRTAGNIANWEEFQEATPGFQNDAAGRQAYLDSLNSTVVGLSINEIMPSNQTTLSDDFGEYSDWLELYNSTGNRIDISGFGLTDRETELMRFKFPDGTFIEPGGYLIVYCSGRRDPLGTGVAGGSIHAPFALSSYRETVILTDKSGRIIDKITYEEIGADAVYARNADDPGLWELSAQPTPGYPNNADGYERFVAEQSAQGPLYFSEVMFGAADALPDGQGHDWLELHNSSQETIDISRFGLSDNSKNPVKWRFPDGASIEPGGYIVVLCAGANGENGSGASSNNSSKNSSSARNSSNSKNSSSGDSKKKYYETNFGIAASGEVLILSDEQGRLLDKLSTPRLPYGVSYGRTDGKPLYYDAPTPNAPNGAGLSGITPLPAFDNAPGVYDSPLKVSLTADGADIYYTTDCTLPTTSSERYSSPISISENTVIRAIAVRQGYLTGRAATGTFLFTSDGASHTLPIASLVADPDDLWDGRRGIYAFGDTMDPEETPVRTTANYFQGRDSEKGEDEWEREANFSIFGEDKKLAFTQDAAIRIAGSYGRENAQKGFNITAKGELGGSRFNYPFFETRKFAQYKGLVLRAGGQDQRMSKLRDELATGLLDETDANILHQAYKPYVLYLNGEYWGIYFLKEKRNRFFVEQHELGTDSGDSAMDIIKSASQVYRGSSQSWKELMEYVSANGASSQQAYEHIAAEVDVKSFMDYMICEIYSANSDTWNIQYYRMPGGKWKWIYYDFCWSFGNTENGAEHKTLGIRRLSSRPCSDLFNALLENEGWRKAFIERFGELLKTAYSPARVNEKIDELASAIEPEITREREKFNGREFRGVTQSEVVVTSPDVERWRGQVQTVRDFANKRPAALARMIQEEFGLSDSRAKEVFGDYAE